MNDVIIQVERLSKKYRIRHQRPERYVALRDVIADRIANLLRPAPAAGEHIDVEDFWALKDVSFEVKRGDVLGIIGRNGAGKSTLLKVLGRITEPTGGRAVIAGRVASLLEVGTGFHPELTGRENIFLNGAILGMSRAEIRSKFDEIVDFAGIEQFLDTPVKRYSSGMYVRLAFAVAAHLEPEILIVDEVLAVGDAQFQNKCLGKMSDVAKRGRTVLYVSHQMAAIENLCRTGLLLERGQVKFLGSAREAIAAYSRSDEGDSKQQSLLQSADRRGNGALRFTEMRIFDADGKPLKTLVSGGTAVIEFGMRNAPHAVHHQLHVSIGVDNALGQRVTTWSTSYVGGDFPSTPAGDFTVRVRLPKLALMPGIYSFHLFSTIRGDVADWLLPAGSFAVEAGDYYASGQLPGVRDGVFISDHAFELA